MASFRWRRLDLPGTDRATLSTTDAGYLLLGHAQFRDDKAEVDLHYSVQITPTWRTQRAHVHGMGPAGPLQLEIEVSPDGNWKVNGRECPAVTGCIDVDLNFTPATNLLSVRRLGLELAQSPAWLEYPAFELKPLRQFYHRLPDNRYAYQCPEIPFEATLVTNADGFVTSYPPLWEPERA
jgi:hypothetical protein